METSQTRSSVDTLAAEALIRVAVIRSGPRTARIHRILKWCHDLPDVRSPIQIDADDSRKLSDAEVAFEHPESTVIVAVDFTRQKIGSLIQRALERHVELIVVTGDASIRSNAPPFRRGRLHVTPGNPTDLLRKAVLRLWADRSTRTEPIPFDRLTDYFALRYRVWKALGYLTEHVDHDRGWEANYSDLTATPIGMFRRDDDRLIGCARLVRQKGAESSYANEIREALRCSPVLFRSVNDIHYDHPFDMFDPFPGFWDYYGPIAKARIPRAEVSRVIVDPEIQGHGVGEVLMDHLVTSARESAIRRLFLACKPVHERFYGRCGFTKIPHLDTDRFGGGVDVSAIAMELRLDG